MRTRVLTAFLAAAMFCGLSVKADFVTEPHCVLQGISCPYQLEFGDFVGGCGPKQYGNRCEKRLATWVYGSRSADPKMEATFRVEPFPPSAGYELIISGQDDDAEAKCTIRLWVNDTKIFEGQDPFVRLGWSRHTFRIPAAALTRHSRLRIENAEDTSRSGGPPFFMLNYAVVRKVR